MYITVMIQYASKISRLLHQSAAADQWLSHIHASTGILYHQQHQATCIIIWQC